MAGPDITLDRSSRQPLYLQVAEQVEHAIRQGTIQPGERIENELALASELGLSRPTVRQAIQVLVDKGMLVRKQGVGTQVVHGRISRSVELTSLFDDLVASGQSPRTVILDLSIVPASSNVAAELQLDVGEDVWSLERLRLVGEQPLALMSNFLPLEIIDLREVDLSTSGLYEALRRCGTLMRVARQQIGARRAGARDARLLNGMRGDPLLTMQRTTYDNGGRAVEFGRHAYRADLYSFEATLVAR